MTNYLGEWFWGIRRERGWTLAEVARRLGYQNVSKACNKVLRLEREGVVEHEFLHKLATVLGISEGVVRYLIRQDRLAYLRAWEAWVEQPTPISIAMRAVPGFMVGMSLPTEVTTPEQAIAYGQALAARLHKKVFVTLSRRVTVGITEAGEINGHFYARPDSDPAPYMALGRAKFLFRVDGFGAVERYLPDGGTTT